MFRLLPNDKKRKLQKEYLLRRWTLVLGFLFVTFVVASFLLVPSYSRLWINLRDNERQLERIEEQIASLSDPESMEMLDSLAHKVEVLGEQHYFSYLEVIKVLSEKAVEKNIIITDIELALISVEDNPRELTGAIEGIAPSRQSLRGFEDQLKKNELFHDVRGPTLGLGEREDIDMEIAFKVLIEN